MAGSSVHRPWLLLAMASSRANDGREGASREDWGSTESEPTEWRAPGRLYAIEAARTGEVGHRAVHGDHAQDTRRPLKYFVEHVARVGVSKVGGNFGLVPGRIWRWAKNEVCSPYRALQLLIRDHGH